MSMRLSRREREVLCAVGLGCSNREIAELLHIELQTVKNHLYSVMRKMRVHDRRQAFELARENGLIPEGLD